MPGRDSILIQAARQLEERAGLVAQERIVLLAQVSAPGDVRARLHVEHDAGRHGRIGGAAMLGDDRGDRRIFFGFVVDARLGVQVGGLKNLVRLVIARARVDRADDRELVHHRRLLGQIFAQKHARQLAANRGKRAADLLGHVGLNVPGVDVARSAGHPEQDHALAVRQRLSSLGRPAAKSQQIAQRQAGKACQAGLEHAAAADHGQALALARVQVPERVTWRVHGLGG